MDNLGTIFWTFLITFFFVSSYNEDKFQTLKKEFKTKEEELNKNIKLATAEGIKLLNEAKQNENQLEKREVFLVGFKTDLLKSLKGLACLISDIKTIDYELSAEYLEFKSRPAKTEAKRIKELKKETKAILQEKRLLEYKYEYLFKIFPELELYIDNFDEIEKFDNLEDVEENTDRTRFYLEDEEYKKLPVDERNQLALDRYIQRRKSKWQIGRDYEMFIGYGYEKFGWDVEYTGVNEKLEDLGRDLIAKKDNKIHIIQCKYWSKNKMIHEKHICQLYGTTIQYKLVNKIKTNVEPVFITNIHLSETARAFAKYLKVEIQEGVKFEEFPRIKCNINKDTDGNLSKIYHLPMDQQYDRTKICNKDECFAWTIEEAVSRGFRRAKKYFGK